MLGAAIIVLRETLEAALLIGIIAAATCAVPSRGRWISGGIALGLAGAAVVALLAGQIAVLFDGVGQELFNAAVLALAVAMLAWHQVWMSAHGAGLAAGARRVADAVRAGRSELSAVLVVVALAVLREGSETALFLYGLVSGGEADAPALAAGVAIGVVGGALLGVLLYAGLLRIPLRWLFAATSALILFLAAGMASRMTGFLIQADVLPGLPGMQVVAYALTLITLLGGMWWARKRQR